MLKVGDLVYHCIRWTPNKKKYEMHKGVGIVTMVVIEGSRRKARVMWKNGSADWLPEAHLVNKKNVVGHSA